MEIASPATEVARAQPGVLTKPLWDEYGDLVTSCLSKRRQLYHMKRDLCRLEGEIEQLEHKKEVVFARIQGILDARAQINLSKGN